MGSLSEAGSQPAAAAPDAEARKGIAAVLLQTLAAILSFFVAKDTLAWFGPEPLVMMRSCAAAVILLTLVKLMPGDPPQWKRGDWLRLAALGVLGVPLNQGLYFHGLSMSSAAHAALLYGLTPALVLLIGRLRGTERLTPARVGGIAVAFAGVVVVLMGRAPEAGSATGIAARQLAGEHALRGDLWILGAVLAWSIYTAYSRDVVARLGTVRATSGALAIGALLFIPIGMPGFLAIDWSAVPREAWIGVVWFALVASTFSYLAWYYAIRRLAPSRVAIFNNVQPVGTALGAWALGAPPSVALFLGAALVIFGVVLAQRSRTPAA